MYGALLTRCSIRVNIGAYYNYYIIIGTSDWGLVFKRFSILSHYMHCIRHSVFGNIWFSLHKFTGVDVHLVNSAGSGAKQCDRGSMNVHQYGVGCFRRIENSNELHVTHDNSPRAKPMLTFVLGQCIYALWDNYTRHKMARVLYVHYALHLLCGIQREANDKQKCRLFQELDLISWRRILRLIFLYLVSCAPCQLVESVEENKTCSPS